MTSTGSPHWTSLFKHAGMHQADYNKINVYNILNNQLEQTHTESIHVSFEGISTQRTKNDLKNPVKEWITNPLACHG